MGDNRCWCAAPLAYLISGQGGRHADDTAFQHMGSGSAAGGLNRLQSLVFDRAANCTPPIHVYVLLTLGSLRAPSFGGALKSRPTPTAGEIKAFYYGKGAARVEVVLLNSTTSQHNFEMMKADVIRVGSRAYFTSPSRWWQHVVTSIDVQASIANTGKPMAATYVNQRWAIAREVWQRHLVYRFAHERSKRAKYRFFLYVREDTAWLSPPAQLASFASTHLCSPPSSNPVAIVDENCGWGSYHDKVFLVNVAAGDALFGRTYGTFVARLVAWLQLATLPPDSPLRPLPLPRIKSLPAMAQQGTLGGLIGLLVRMQGQQRVDSMQSEYILSVWLHHAQASVHMKPFHRTDVRQPQGSTSWCIPHLYWQCVDHDARARSRLPKCTDPPVRSIRVDHRGHQRAKSTGKRGLLPTSRRPLAVALAGAGDSRGDTDTQDTSALKRASSSKPANELKAN